MSQLAQQQQALLASLFDWPPDNDIKKIASYIDVTWTRGLKVYQSNAHVLAQRSLAAAYPVLVQLLGADSFDALARDFWHRCPPTCGDVAQWGADLDAFVRDNEQLAEEPYLADVASLEWALHLCASAADCEVDAMSFALLGEHDPDELHPLLAPGAAVMSSAWPVVSILSAHRDQHPGLDEVGQRLRAGVGESAVVWRAGLRPTQREALPGETPVLSALLKGQTLGQALECSAALDLDVWLTLAVQSGLLLGVRRTRGAP